MKHFIIFFTSVVAFASYASSADISSDNYMNNTHCAVTYNDKSEDGEYLKILEKGKVWLYKDYVPGMEDDEEPTYIKQTVGDDVVIDGRAVSTIQKYQWFALESSEWQTYAYEENGIFYEYYEGDPNPTCSLFEPLMNFSMEVGDVWGEDLVATDVFYYDFLGVTRKVISIEYEGVKLLIHIGLKASDIPMIFL